MAPKHRAFASSAVRRWFIAGALLSAALTSCFEDPDTLVEGNFELDVTGADGGEIAQTCGGEKGCPCVLDSDCLSTYCAYPEPGPGGPATSGVCDDPCGDGCPAGQSCKSVGRGGKKKFACVDDVVVPGCEPVDETCNGTDDDCDGQTDDGVLCDDDNACTFDSCDAALATDLADGCTHTGLATSCDDGNPCTEGDGCAAGVCAAGSAKDCDDGNPCTADGCDATGACVHPLQDGAPCDDGSVCTGGDACKGGVCSGSTLPCDDQDPCTDDVCGATTGCAHSPNKAACDDGDACTAGDACDPATGACASGKAPACDDGNPCTKDACDPALAAIDLAKGCTSTAIAGPCNDGNPCTATDGCQDGACKGTALKDCDDGNPCTIDACDPEGGDCTASPASSGDGCDDGNACTVDDACDDKGGCFGAAKSCDDGIGCTLDLCDANLGTCYFENNSGFACEDGNLCTLGDACKGGNCVPGNSKLCDDALVCTDDSCDAKTGDCVFTNNTHGCDDGNPCTKVDACKGGTCQGSAPVSCDDGNICTIEACDTAVGTCESKFAADNVICSDGDACSGGDACKAGKCASGPKLWCEDGNPCTDDGCDAKTGACAFAPNNAACDDGNKCSTGDTCAAGACKGGANACECQTTADCKDKEDGNACNGTLVCNPQTNNCEVDGNSVVVCDPANNGACVTFSCVVATGVCAPSVKPDGSGCEADDSVCTVGDVCSQGQCLQGKAQVCDDANPCTDDACDPKVGCKQTPNALPCFDGDLCTKGDVCKGGSCQDGATAKNCSDNDVCTTDSCNSKTGNCVFAPLSGNACDDGNACTSADACDKGGCKGGTVKICDDGNTCTLDGCDAKSGKCFAQSAFETQGCDDGKPCTKGDTCKSGLCTAGLVPSCDDGNPCTLGSCVAATGDCQQKPGNQGGPCSDGNACTILDVCDQGVCKPASNKLCDDDDVCTVDACDNASGLCSHLPTVDGFQCSDGNLCTNGDSCKAGVCTPGAPAVCDDANICTIDGCDPKTGKCTTKPVPVSPLVQCNDDNACTYDTTIYKLYAKVGDACWNGVCSGTPVNCNDGNVCTQDSCDPKSGCKHQFLGNVGCNDGNACTTGDTCASGSCKGVGQTCNDGNGCTSDSCDPKKGCVFAANTAGCNDGNVCTTGDKCTAGTCQGPGALDCADGYACTDDLCDPAKGCKLVVDDSNPCSDDEPCTTGDHCDKGSCVATGPTVCNDNSVCTTDSCEKGVGCIFKQIGTKDCDDGNACSLPDVCSGGKCVAAGQLDCDDKDVCTTDTCDTKVGCKHAAFSGPCDDGDACSTGDACKAGVCAASGKLSCNDGTPCTTDGCDPKVGCSFPPVTGVAQTQLALRSDVATQVATVFVAGQPKDLAPAQALTSAPAAWAKVGSGLYVAAASCAKATTPGEIVHFLREISLPGAAKVGKATLQVAAAGSFSCALGGIDVLSGVGAGKAVSADVAAALKGGETLLRCALQTDGLPKQGGAFAPCGLSFELQIDIEVPSVLCDDGNACTGLDLCEKGVCTGSNGLSCNDGNPCTKDACDPAKGCGLQADDAAACSDGDACTGPDFCKGGSCFATAKTSCSDNNDCTADSCDAEKGCSHVAVDPGAAKGASTASSTKTLCATSAKAIGGLEVPQDAKPCAATYAGHPEWTKLSGATWVWSDDIIDNPLKDETIWIIQPFDVPAGVEQLQGTLTFAVDAAASCRVGADLVASTPGGGKPWQKAVTVPIGSWLKPGKQELVCKVTNFGDPKGTILSNPAGLLFTIDLSWYDAGAAKPCTDGNACTKDDGCVKGLCLPGPLLDCDDSNACTLDVCSSKDGCGHTVDDSQPCNDGDVCSEGDACLKGKCTASKKKSCDDGNTCTADACDPLAGCGGKPVAGTPGCDDGSACTANSFCVEGACKAGDATDCADGKVCTVDGCDAKKGCSYGPAKDGISCDDGDTCTANDLCANGLCLGEKTAPCDDGNACTKDACDVKKGCVNSAATGGVCDDGDSCTQGDVCVVGVCKPGAVQDCFDSEQCTADSCDSASGKCVFSAVSDGECDDGNLCTLNDECKAGKCMAGPPPTCGDGDPCTVDNCAPDSGKCLHDPATPGAACDDGNLCTESSKCVDSKCIGVAKPCDDSNACTADVCDPQSGKCNSTALKDGAACGGTSTCVSGICTKK